MGQGGGLIDGKPKSTEGTAVGARLSAVLRCNGTGQGRSFKDYTCAWQTPLPM